MPAHEVFVCDHAAISCGYTLVSVKQNALATVLCTTLIANICT